MGIKEFIKARPLKARNDVRTNASDLTLRQSIFPLILVTTLFFLWGFSYGMRLPTPSPDCPLAHSTHTSSFQASLTP